MRADANLDSNMQRILIVDDSRMVRATLKKHLTDHYDIIEEADGEAGWARLSMDPSIQLMISDVSMPKLDGHGLLQRIRSAEDEHVRKVPVIIISGDEEESAKQHAVSLGASDFITKSTDKVELLARIQSNLQRVSAEKDLIESKEALETTTTNDPITGLFTQNYLLQQGEKFVAYSRRHNESLAVVAVALDRFDELTQRYPAPVCNKILQLFGKLIASKLRNEEVIARCEDQYFAIAMPATTVNQALIATERLCQAANNAKINYKGDVLRLTCSVGLATSEQQAEDAPTFVSLLELASFRLMQAQDQGGNWIEAQALPKAPEPEPEPAPEPEPLPEERAEGEYLTTPDVDSNAPPPDLATALAWLEAGKMAEVMSYLPDLLSPLLPLLDLTERVYQIGLPIEALKARLGLSDAAD